METLKEFSVLSNQSYSEVLTPELLEFLNQLHQEFGKERLELLEKRIEKQRALDSGVLPWYPTESAELRANDWTCAPIPQEVVDRRVEITGPVDKKMIVNALNSGANCYMADFEDSTSPTWENIMEGQKNLFEATRGKLSFTADNGKFYEVKEKPAVLMVRPRGLHLEEKHLSFSGDRASASLVDFGIYFFHNAKVLLEKASRPYFYLPKLEYYKEARWWNKVFVFAQNYLGLPVGTIRATVLIETLSASFELDEILYELKEHCIGLNCGRWDYLFSMIKKLRSFPEYVVGDRSELTMSTAFMSAYSKRVIDVCHRRGVSAMGGMAAQIPVKGDEEKNKASFLKVRKDKEREVKNGHDGTWVAHPGMVGLAKEVFDEYMKTPNQILVPRTAKMITASDLLDIPKGDITQEGIRLNIRVGILYIESWLMGRGAAALYHLMEDAATAEISRTQLWQWITHEAKTKEGKLITKELVQEMIVEELPVIEAYVGKDRFNQGRFKEARELFEELVFSSELEEFLTLKAYEIL